MEKKYISGVITLEDGTSSEFFLTDEEVGLLEKEVGRMQMARRARGDLRSYNLADDLVCGAIASYLDRLRKNARVEAGRKAETPAVEAARESVD